MWFALSTSCCSALPSRASCKAKEVPQITLFDFCYGKKAGALPERLCPAHAVRSPSLRQAGTCAITVTVLDIFGNDTLQTFEVVVKQGEHDAVRAL